MIGVSPGQDAVIELSLAPGDSPDGALSQFFQQQGVQAAAGWNVKIHGLPTAARAFSAQTEGGALQGLVAFVAHEGKVFRLLGYASSTAWPAREREIRTSLSSFDRVVDREILNVQPMRIDIVNPDRTLSLTGFAQAYDAAVGVNTLALINHVVPEATLPSGRSYKNVVGDVG